MIKSIKYIIVSISIFIFLGCNSDSSNGNLNSAIKEVLTEEELKQILYEKECSNGVQYLDGNLQYKPKYKNLLSSKVKGLKLTCKIKNNATLAILKDIKAKVLLESKTGAIILEKEFDIYEFIKPNKTFVYKTEIQITNQDYIDLYTVNWTILNASCK